MEYASPAGRAAVMDQPLPPRAWIERDLRKVSAAATAGLVCGFVVNGVGSRLAMMLLARLNPQATGRISDDGFRIGQLTGETAGLVIFGTIVGVLGGLLFLSVRDLRFGPRWFQVASMTIGPAVVVGNMLVHTDGIDFRVLEPTWLAIGLFVALPGLFALSVSWLTDRWTRPDSWAMGSRRAWRAGLLSLIAMGPAILFALQGAAARALHQVARPVRLVVAHTWTRTAVRLVLIAVFSASLLSLIGKSRVLLA